MGHSEDMLSIHLGNQLQTKHQLSQLVAKTAKRVIMASRREL